MRKFNKIAIIGVGEIGGSIGIDVKRKKLAKEVVGICRRKRSPKTAKEVKAVDRAFLLDKMRDVVKDSDFIILATPVCKIIELGREIAPFVKEGAIITDVGSTKVAIVKALEKTLPKNVNFVGSHPMAGTEKGGVANAKGNLFKGHDCFIMKTKNKRALNMVKAFWKALGAKTIVISSKKHDEIVAKVSQMVHIVASSLVLSNKDILRYTASGFRDTTRIALADARLWREICVTNNKGIAKSLDKTISILKRFRSAIIRKDASQLQKMLEQARRLRQNLNK